MITREQVELNVINGYIDHVKRLSPANAYYARRYILILEIQASQLKRYLRKIPLKLDELATLKHGIRNAERFLNEIYDVGC